MVDTTRTLCEVTNFFLSYNEKKNMRYDVDSLCSHLAIAVIVLLLCMGYVEFSKRSSHRSPALCGRKANINTNAKGTSAKVAKTEAKEVDDSDNSSTVDENNLEYTMEVPENTSGCKHVELKQDDQAIKDSYYEWNAGEDVNKKFERVAVSADLVKKYANTRPFHISGSDQSNSSWKKLGKKSAFDTMLQLSGHKDSCPLGDYAFGESECYAQAKESAKCQEVYEKMEEEKE